MSKMFEALVNKEGEVSRLVQQLGSAPLTAAAPVSEPVQPMPKLAKPVTAISAASRSGFIDAARMLPLQVAAEAPVFPFNAANTRAAEQYRITRTKLLHDPRQPHVIVVSSSAPQDGKTITSINLAGVLALRPELKVVLVEADLRHTHIAGLLGFPSTPGLSDVLSGKAELADALVRVEQCPNLFVLPGGSKHANATELLDSPGWRTLCETLRREFSYVIVDSPPLGVLADFELLQAVSDGVVFVVRPDHTNRDECKKALDAVGPSKLLGVILNATEEWVLYRAGHSKYDSYYTQAPNA